MKVLLAEPDYYTRYPSLGLLKLGAFHREKKDNVVLVRGRRKLDFEPDRVYVTSLFTWDWKAVWKSVRYYKKRYPKTEIRLGGIYASLLPQHAELSGADVVSKGILSAVEGMLPDYSLVPEWSSSIVFATRGCPRKCGFCSVPKLEGPPTVSTSTVRPLIAPGHQKVVFFDNNILGLPNAEDILLELIELGVQADFNQGMDVRYLNESFAALLSRVKMPVIRMAFDYSGIRPWVERGIGLLKEHGIRGRRLVFYVLHNYVDDPEDFFIRVRDLLSWGVVVYPMRYEPLTTLQKGVYVAPKWTAEELNMVARARRVIGYGGAFPPYKALLDKFRHAESFQQAFSLRPEKKRHAVPIALQEMALEHQQQDTLPKHNFPSWRREKDWRKVLATPATSSRGR